MEDEDLIKRLVVFAVLMETGEGIVSKSPEYILEKYYSALSVRFPENLLDLQNKTKFERWMDKWMS